MKMSIIIPCYNAEKWIARSVRSALEQTHKDTEVIFVDNESTDDSYAIAKSVGSDYSNFFHDKVKNIYPHCWDEPRSRGLEMMTGDYVMVLGADDFIEETFVEKCLNILHKAKGKIRVFQSPIAGVDENGDMLQKSIHNYKSLQEFKDLCLRLCPVNSPSVVYDAKLYKEGMFESHPEKYGGAADYDLYCRLADNGVFIYPFPEWLGYYYRWHPGQATWKVQKEGKNYDKMIQDYWRDKWISH